MSEMDKPELPEPDKAPTGAEKDTPPDPKANGNGGTPINGEQPMYLSTDKLIEWMEATDKELKLLRIQGAILTVALVVVIFAIKPKLPTPPTA